MYQPTAEDWPTISAYRQLCDRARIWQQMKWRGHDAAKCPDDMWLYQETIAELRPTLIVEFGTAMGGSALFYADMMDLMGIDGQVISIDNEVREPMPQHDRLTFLIGHSRHDEIIDAVKTAVRASRGPVMFVEDSEHTAQHVVGELEIYSDLVTVGSYFVIEDMDYPEVESPIRGAVAEFLKLHPEFEVDTSKDRYLVSVAPGGWLKRIK